jgi:uncharacterized membrane protein (GlpM family)
MDAAVRDILVKSVLGGLIIALVLTLARFRLYVLSGLLVSVPAVSLYTFWWIGREHGTEKMRVAIHAALWSAIPWALYLLVAYLLAGRVSNWLALGAGVLTYLAANSLVWLMLHRLG